MVIWFSICRISVQTGLMYINFTIIFAFSRRQTESAAIRDFQHGTIYALTTSLIPILCLSDCVSKCKWEFIVSKLGTSNMSECTWNWVISALYLLKLHANDHLRFISIKMRMTQPFSQSIRQLISSGYFKLLSSDCNYIETLKKGKEKEKLLSNVIAFKLLGFCCCSCG